MNTTITLDCKLYQTESSATGTQINYGDYTSSVNVTTGNSMPQLQSVPVSDVYVFCGYYDTKSGTGTKYYNADGSSARTWDIELPLVTLYALWRKRYVSVGLSSGDFVFPSSSTDCRGKVLSESNIRDITSKIVNRNYKLSLDDFSLSNDGNILNISKGIAVIKGYRVVVSDTKSILIPEGMCINNNERNYRVYLALHTQTSSDNSVVIDTGSNTENTRYLYLTFEEFESEDTKYPTVNMSGSLGMYTRKQEKQSIDSGVMSQFYSSELGGEIKNPEDTRLISLSGSTISRDISTTIPRFDEKRIDSMYDMYSNSINNVVSSLLIGYIYISNGSIYKVETESFNSTKYIDASRIYYGGLTVDEYLMETGSFVGSVGENIISSKINISNREISYNGSNRTVEEITKVRTPRLILSSIDTDFNDSNENAIPYYNNFISIGEKSEDKISDNISEISTFYKETSYSDYISNSSSIEDLLLEVRSIKNTTGHDKCRSDYAYSMYGDIYKGYINLGMITEGSHYGVEFKLGMSSAMQSNSYVEGTNGYLSISDIETSLVHTGTVRLRLLTGYESFVGNAGEFYYTDELESFENPQSSALFYNRAGFGGVDSVHKGIILEAVDDNGDRVYRYPSYSTGEVIPTSELETDPITGEVTTERGCIYLDGYLADSSDQNKYRPNIRMNGHLKVDHYVRAKRVYNAVYNDYAEWYNSSVSSTIEPGDVIYYSIENDDYRNISDKPELVVGICTNNYGIIVGGDELGEMEMNRKKYVPVSLCGRVNVKIHSCEDIKPGCILYADGSNIASMVKSEGCKIGKVIKVNNNNNTALVQVSM